MMLTAEEIESIRADWKNQWCGREDSDAYKFRMELCDLALASMTSVKEQNKGLAFEEWFKREYPLYFDASRAMRDTTLYEQLRKAWNAAREPATEAVLHDEYDQKSVDIIKNLSMLVRRLCYKHPNDKLTDQAMAYLRGEKLEGNILRASPSPEPQPIHRECEQCGNLVACWSDAQIEAIERDAAALHAKIKPLIDAAPQKADKPSGQSGEGS